ncbi:hypothetical protein BDZ94DRAFT_1232854 [Collybia nuda]|uniref:Uncharacterized protein n=1 Tax=Collybia nuda TaxID=64659 RepID=A0A9P5YET9_9AGAR|nr:hypothetical protein BDZ94DRAFT_1232854 [Collybia nuda]
MKAQFSTLTTAILGVFLAAHTTVAQNSCTAVAYLGQIPPAGGSCTGQELGDASQNAPGFGRCEEVTNGSCILTEAFEGACAIHLYSDSNCNTPITGGNTIMCGDPPTNVNFNSFQVECCFRIVRLQPPLDPNPHVDVC